jgi:hypothetical protein
MTFIYNGSQNATVKSKTFPIDMDQETSNLQNSFYQLVKRLGVEEEDVGDILSYVAFRAHENYKSTRIKAEIDNAVKSAKLAVQVTSEGNPSLADRLNNLGIMLGS